MLKQHVIVDFNHFITTLSKNRKNVKSLATPSLIRMSLHLLENLPAAREVIFEYFSLVADVAVQSYVETESKTDSRSDARTSGGQRGMSSPSSSSLLTQSGSNNSVSSTSGTGTGVGISTFTSEEEQQNCFDQIEETLINVIQNNPSAWSAIVASWSLDLIGTLSQSLARHNFPLSRACNYWLKCSTMRGLLNLTCLSFSKLNSDESEYCVEALFSKK